MPSSLSSSSSRPLRLQASPSSWTAPRLAGFRPRGDDKEAAATFEWFRDTLKGNGLKLDETTYWLGRTLVFDPEADALLTRPYRKPFVVPQKV